MQNLSDLNLKAIRLVVVLDLYLSTYKIQEGLVVQDNSSEYHVNQECKSYLTDLDTHNTRTTLDRNLKKLQWALVPIVTHHFSLQSTNQPSISAEEDIIIYDCGSPLGRVTKIIKKNIYSPEQKGSI